MDEASKTQVSLAVPAPPLSASAHRRTVQFQAADRSGDGVGVAWDGSLLHVAHVRATAGQLPTLVSTRAIRAPPPGEALAESDHVGLSNLLNEVCRDLSRAQVWTALDSPAILTQIIRVPSVRDRLLPNVALWTLRKAKSIGAEGAVLDFEVLRTVEQDGARQLELFAVVAPRAEIDHATAEFRAAGHPLAGVAPNALAFRNLLRFAWPVPCQGQCVLVCVNDENTEVLLVCDGKPLGTRSVRTGMNSLRHAFAQHLDVDVMDPRIEECMGVLRGGPIPANLAEHGAPLSTEDIFGWVRPAARRLVRNVQRALHGFEVEHGVGDGAVFLITGRIIAYSPVGRFLGTQLGVHLYGLTDPGHTQGLRPPVSDPVAPLEDGHGRAVAIGLALAAVYTTGNFLVTFQDRLAEQRRRRAQQAALALGVAVLLVLLCVVGYLQARVHHVQRECERLRASHPERGSQQSEGADIASLMARVGAAQTTARKLAEVYYAPALVAELASLTTPPVHLLAVDLRLATAGGGRQAVSGEAAPARTAAGRRAEAQQTPDATGPAAADRQRPSRLMIQGVIAGQHDRVDAELAAYVLRLRESPFLDGPVVTEHRVEGVDAACLAFGPQGADHMLFFSVEAGCRRGVQNRVDSGAPSASPRVAAQTAASQEARP